MKSIFYTSSGNLFKALGMSILFVGTIVLCWSSVQWVGAAFSGMHDQFNLIILFADVN